MKKQLDAITSNNALNHANKRKGINDINSRVQITLNTSITTISNSTNITEANDKPNSGKLLTNYFHSMETENDIPANGSDNAANDPINDSAANNTHDTIIGESWASMVSRDQQTPQTGPKPTPIQLATNYEFG